MAITRVQIVTQTATETTLLSVTYSATVAGNLLVAVVNLSNNSAITAPAGWSLAIGKTNGTSTQTAIYYRVAAPSTTSITFTLGSAPLSATIEAGEWSFSGFAGNPGLDVTASNSGSSSSPSTGTTGTTGHADALVIGGLGQMSANAYSVPTNSFAIAGQQAEGVDTSSSSAMLEKIVSAVATYTTGATAAGSAAWAGVIAVFSASPASSTIEWHPPIEQPVRPRRPLVNVGWFAFPTEPSLYTPYTPALGSLDWLQPQSIPVRRPPPAPQGFTLLGGAWPDIIAGVDLTKWYMPPSEPVRPKPRALQGWFAFGGALDAQDVLPLSLWWRPIVDPVRVRPRVTPGWFAFGGDPSQQGYGVLDFYVPSQHPVLRVQTDLAYRRLFSSASGMTVEPLEPTQIRPDIALTGWFRALSTPIFRVPQRLPGGSVQSVEPTHTSPGQAIGWYVPLTVPVRRPPPVTPGWFTLTMHPDSLHVIRLDAWHPQIAEPVRPRPERDPRTRRPDLMQYLALPLEPTQLGIGGLAQWYVPLSIPVRPKPAAIQTPPAEVQWFQVPDLQRWYVPMCEPVRRPAARPDGMLQGIFQFVPPPEQWTAGVVVAGPFYVIAADFYQAGAVVGDMRVD